MQKDGWKRRVCSRYWQGACLRLKCGANVEEQRGPQVLNDLNIYAVDVVEEVAAKLEEVSDNLQTLILYPLP